MLNKYKKGQVGETTTWLIAIVLIVVILLFFIFGASLLASTKSIKAYKESITSTITSEPEDVFLKKSVISYYSLEEEGEKNWINVELQKMGDADKFELSLEKTMKEIGENVPR